MAKALPVESAERLPWLSDPAPTIARRRRSLAPPLLFLGLMAAIGIGGWTVLQYPPEPGEAPVQSASEVRLPPPTAVAPPPAIEPQAPSASERQALRPKVAHEPAPSPAAERPRNAENPSSARSRPPTRSDASKVSKAPASRSAPPKAAYNAKAWRSGVPGRIIQIGAYRSSATAQSEWRRVYYRYPLLRPLSPRVMKSRVGGRTYYRLQLGTFSQAHSELLCQRLRATGQGCMVVGLPKRGRR